MELKIITLYECPLAGIIGDNSSIHIFINQLASAHIEGGSLSYI